MKSSISLFGIGFIALGLTACSAPRLNNYRVIGTHNSYHVGLDPQELSYYRTIHAPQIESLVYKHPSLTTQLDNGVRQIELDIVADPYGGLYANPAGRQWATQAGFRPKFPFDTSGIMTKPGFKVMHIPDIDYRSNCQPFVECLREVRRWSDTHPKHDPVFVLIEVKDKPLHIDRPTVTPVVLTPALFDQLDSEILSVFEREKLIIPDDLRGAASTLPEAIHRHGWPKLCATKGKIIFLLDQRQQTSFYSAGHPALRGRVIFANAPEGTPESAFIEHNDPRDRKIPDLIRKGYLVRTRADEDLQDIDLQHAERRDAARASGAQIISTDFPRSEPSSSGYMVE